MNYTGPKVKLSRKLDLRLTPKASKVAEKKPYAPGQHGSKKKRSKQSDYGKQLFEKQKLRLQYNISERQMSNYYAKARKMVGNTGENYVQLLETRLDALVYRSRFARTMYAARQAVQHGHITVNGKKVDIPSYAVKLNDVISVKEKSKKIEAFQEAIRNSAAPAYLEVSKAEFLSKLAYIPTREEIPVVCEIPLVVEYYSR